eukprot:TRINITY_DN1810_c0_g2_i1.p1 TRINITY_DN1810_c0_g2~~TRINITY_DN1810_c0_g2_i1.p1  ORF type:complete len:272 (-),score=24.79 TRINITY_DN1810_c0_g2_i1:495-1310(-)
MEESPEITIWCLGESGCGIEPFLSLSCLFNGQPMLSEEHRKSNIVYRIEHEPKKYPVPDTKLELEFIVTAAKSLVLENTGKKYSIKFINLNHLKSDISNLLMVIERTNAIFYFIKKGVPYSLSLQHTLTFYCKLFESVIDRFVIIHTAWDPYDEDNDQAVLMSKREKSFQDLEIIHPALRKAPHFFIDSVIRTENYRNPLALPKKILTFNTFDYIMNRALSFPSTTLNLLAIPKSDSIFNRDMLMLEHLKSTIAGMKMGLAIETPEKKDIS